MTWILTHSGRRLDLLDPSVDSICIDDIAHALSHCCRFAGHARVFYSVAQHSVKVSWIVNPAFALEGLLHDAAEAYLGDLTRPLKKILAVYWAAAAIESHLETVIWSAFGLRDPKTCIPADGCWPDIKAADRILLATERRDLMPHSTEPWEVIERVEPLDRRIEPWSSAVAKCNFLARFHDLTAERAASNT